MAKHKVLYVEDYPVIQQMYHDVLKSHGFDVDVANDGKQAMEKLKNGSYDVVLLDLLLPQVTGTEFLRDLRAGEHKDQFVVVLSDFDKPEMVSEVKSLGVKHYWIKVENTPHLLAQRLEHLLKKE
jgi:two-component system response regulator SaeR